MVDIGAWQHTVANCRSEFKAQSLPAEECTKISTAIEEFGEAIHYNFNNINSTVDKLRNINMNGRVVEMLSNLSRKLNYNITSKSMDEDTFTMQIIDPILNAYMDNTIPGLEYYGCTHILEESTMRKYKNANNTNTESIMGRKPDRSGVIKTRSGNKHTVFIYEIKTDSNCKGRPDLAKIASLMKDALDYTLICNVSREEYSTIGLLVEGIKATVLSLDLPISGLYRLVKVDSFHFPCSIEDVSSLVNAYKSLMNMCDLIDKCVRLLTLFFGNIHNEDIEVYLRPTCGSHLQYSDYIEA